VDEWFALNVLHDNGQLSVADRLFDNTTARYLPHDHRALSDDGGRTLVPTFPLPHPFSLRTDRDWYPTFRSPHLPRWVGLYPDTPPL